MKKRSLIPLLSIFVFIFSYSGIKAQLNGKLLVFETNYTVKVDDYPFYTIGIKATLDGAPFTLKSENLVIIENNLSTVPTQVEPPNSDGYQLIHWTTKVKGMSGSVSKNVPIYLSVIITEKEKNVRLEAFYFINAMSQVRVANLYANVIKEINFGRLAPGETSTYRINIKALSGLMDGIDLKRVKLDSIRFTGNTYGYTWFGSILNAEEPPTLMYVGFDYRALIRCTPTEDKYLRDKLTVYYEGGMKEVIDLITNFFPLQTSTNLQLKTPNGGEVYTPCQQVLLKWKGSLITYPTKIEYSKDNGSSWSEVATVKDSMYLWTVPSDITSSARIRVSQIFQATNTSDLTMSEEPIVKNCYNSTGYSALGVNRLGEIFEWDLIKLENKFTYLVGDYVTINDVITPKGICYFSSDSRIALCYNMPYSIYIQDTIAIFDTSTVFPIKKIAVKSGFNVQKIYTNYSKDMFILVSDLCSSVLLYSTKDGSFIAEHSFDKAISSFSVNDFKNEAIVAFYNGDISIYSLPDFVLTKKIEITDIPIVNNIKISPNSKLVALGCMAPLPTSTSGNNSENHLFDIESNQIIRTKRSSYSDIIGMSFSPSSSNLVIGTKAQPQIQLWDLSSDEITGTSTGANTLLNDFNLSPEGHSMLVSSNADKNFTVRFMSYPESDQSDFTFKIVRPEVDIQTIVCPSKYIGTENTVSMNNVVCNNGMFPFAPYGYRLLHGYNFKLIEQLPTDSLFTGDCMSVRIGFCPLDTGMVTDSIVINTCAGSYYIPLIGYGLNRNITFYEEVFDFGPVCLYDASWKEFTILRNDDPVPLKVNELIMPDNTNNPFYIVQHKDTILQPGESLTISAGFIPYDNGIFQRDVYVRHSGQTKVSPKTLFSGEGIGTRISSSLKDLRFIPEIPIRKITIYNQSKNDVQVVSTDIENFQHFRLVTPLPITVPALGENYLEIEWDGISSPDISIKIEAAPCASTESIVLGLFSGHSTITALNTEADPRSNAVLTVKFDNLDNKPYNGKRFFESEITINPRMFLPLSVSSNYGEASIIRNDISGDRRIMGIRIDGDFPTNGVLVDIKGVAGIAESDTSAIGFVADSKFWGTSVKTQTVPGMFKLINLCDTRRLLQIPSFSILELKPNPLTNDVSAELSLASTGDCSVSISIFDELGNIVQEIDNFIINKGINSVAIDAANLNSGAYRVVISNGLVTATANFVVVR
jgi:hypothetical protein